MIARRAAAASSPAPVMAAPAPAQAAGPPVLPGPSSTSITRLPSFLIAVLVTSIATSASLDIFSMIGSGKSGVADLQSQILRKSGPLKSSVAQQHRQNKTKLPLRTSTNVDVVKLVNDKYKSGRPSNVLGENGLLIHMSVPWFPMAGPVGDWDMDVWSKIPLSCSIINARTPQVFPQGSSYFNLQNSPHVPVGYIFKDINVPIQCVLPFDGATAHSRMKDSEWSGCACLGDNPSRVPNDIYICMMPSSRLKEMMELSEHTETYNEVVIPKQYWKEVSLSSGGAIMAFFYLKGSPAREEAVASHKNYLSYTHQNSSQTPLLEYDATNKQQPFIDYNWLSRGSPDEFDWHFLNDYWWVDLPDKARAAASLLGFDEEMWDGEESTPLYEKALDELSDAKRRAASLLKLEGEFSTHEAG